MLHSWKANSATRIVEIVSKESMVPALTTRPVLAVTRPNVMKTSGEIKINASSHKENLSSDLAQTVLIVLAPTATARASPI